MQVKVKRDSEEEVKMPKDRSCPLRETAIRRRFSVVNSLYFFPLCPAAWGKDKKKKHTHIRSKTTTTTTTTITISDHPSRHQLISWCHWRGAGVVKKPKHIR
ncbi:hypothetical protein CMV_014761 [Castanea mollissima]|uniref:Uncharacterized protein n=1 Tax=Castanea mollissima TaxID=60419 RepID=A0A8J4VGR0_9ROSI|nr:hypothetical protein CMV_014761 [Castanea mollissima]